MRVRMDADRASSGPFYKLLIGSGFADEGCDAAAHLWSTRAVEGAAPVMQASPPQILQWNVAGSFSAVFGRSAVVSDMPVRTRLSIFQFPV